MRYIIEAITKGAEGIVEEMVEKNKKLKMIDKYDPFEKISRDVETMGLALRQFEKVGIDWQVFNYYLRGKGIPQTTIDAVMGNVRDFFKRVGLLPQDKPRE